MNADLFDLARFISAQDAYDSYNRALEEIKAARKQSHWMWYVFPQIKGLGHSTTSQNFSIKSLEEAKAYLEHETLGRRLRDAVNALPDDCDAEEIFGKIDAMKLRSCMTLFEVVAPKDVFTSVLEKYYEGKRCKRTLSILHKTWEFRLPSYLQTKVYGQTRTLVDLLIELNKQHHYTSSDDALHDLGECIRNIRPEVVDIVFDLTYRLLKETAERCAENGNFSAEKYLEEISQWQGRNKYEGIKGVYQRFMTERVVTLVTYLNDFRRYNSAWELYRDLERITEDRAACDYKINDVIYDFGSPHGSYVFRFLINYLSAYWDKISVKGILDNDALYDFMIGHHERRIEKRGLHDVIAKDYETDGSCHPEVHVPLRGIAGPVYVERKFFTDSSLSKWNTHLIKSCGEGKGPNKSGDYWEFGLIQELLMEDTNYAVAEKQWVIPRYDDTLPVYDLFQHERMLFETDEAKKQFIEDKLRTLLPLQPLFDRFAHNKKIAPGTMLFVEENEQRWKEENLKENEQWNGDWEEYFQKFARKKTEEEKNKENEEKRSWWKRLLGI